MKIIQQGAEAVIYKINNKIIKDRIPKKYRHPELDDKLRKKRTKSEAKIIKKLQGIIPVPKILTDPGIGRMIHMEYIPGKKLSEELENLNLKQVCRQIGDNLSKIHDKNIIHGDLTTSNMILKNKKVYFIDFGLSFNSSRIEDKAVDLHLLKQALKAKHFKNYKIFFESIMQAYKPKDKTKILSQLKKVESRGRYKH